MPKIIDIFIFTLYLKKYIVKKGVENEAACLDSK